MAGTYALFADPAEFIGDDGGITLRYASRLADGEGLSYNDGSRVHGASSPLWTVWLALPLKLGLGPAAAVRVSGALFFALAGAGLAALGGRRGGWALAGFAAALFWTRPSVFLACFTGLESGLVMALAACTLAALAGGRDVLVGVGLGLLVANKLDAGLLAIAFAAAHWIVRRSFPWRVTAVALLAALPMFLFLLWNFGTVIPHSAVTKAGEHATGGGFDASWMIRRLWNQAWWAQLAVPLLLVAALLQGRPRRVELCVAFWYALHLVVYAAIDLGDPYPWYSVSPMFASLAACVLLGARTLEASGTSIPRTQIGSLAIGAAGLALLAFNATRLTARLGDPGPDGRLPYQGIVDLPRLQAGAWLAQHAASDELMTTYYGLPAFAYGGPVHDYSALNSERNDLQALSAQYFIADDAFVLPEAVTSLPHIARFQVADDGVAFNIFARPSSTAARSGARHFLVPLAPAPCPLHASAERIGPNRLRLPPSGCFRQELAQLPPLDLLSETDAPSALRLEITPHGTGTLVHAVSTSDAPLDLHRVRLRVGAPIRTEDLPIRFERWDRRTSYLAEHGYPETRFGPARPVNR